MVDERQERYAPNWCDSCAIFHGFADCPLCEISARVRKAESEDESKMGMLHAMQEQRDEAREQLRTAREAMRRAREELVWVVGQRPADAVRAREILDAALADASTGDDAAGEVNDV